MNAPSLKPARAALVAACFALLPALALLDRGLYEDRRQLGLTSSVELRQAPPLLAFVTAVGGGFRGVVANALWIRAVKLQDDGHYFELYTLADWITKLQPEFKDVWVMQAWNMAWNVSKQFSDPNDRWLWVRSGMELLRDEGLRYNPQDPVIYRELAWIFQDKIGKYTDDAHRRYKQIWGAEMYRLLGTSTKPDALVNPSTDGARASARTLREVYKLDPEWMKQVDEHYGPFDWRVPESHAVYWASMGLRRCGTNDVLPLRRVIWQSIQSAFLRGRLIEYPAENRLDFGPNLDFIPNANRAFEEMKQAEPAKVDYISRAQKNFLKDAIYQLYTHDRQSESTGWFQYARTNFPGLIPEGLPLDEFVVREVTGELASVNPSRVRGILDGVLQHYYRCLSLGEDDEANGHALLARRIHQLYTDRNAKLKNVQLPPLAEIQAEVSQRLGRK